MDNATLEKRVRELEFTQDQLTTELTYLNDLLISIGFPNGLESLKEVGEHMLQEGVKNFEEC